MKFIEVTCNGEKRFVNVANILHIDDCQTGTTIVFGKNENGTTVLNVDEGYKVVVNKIVY